jgi:hypothetical protein
MSQLSELAKLITESLAVLQDEWRKAGVEEPSLEPESADPPAFVSIDADKASRVILGAAKALSILVAGPFRWSTWQVQEVNVDRVELIVVD